MATDEETATSEEEVPRFGLRRGARFLETLRDETGTGDADDEWLADLRPHSGDDVPPEVASPANMATLVTALGEAMATLEERLLVLEEALARATAACTVSRMVLHQAHWAHGRAGAPPREDNGADVRPQD